MERKIQNFKLEKFSPSAIITYVNCPLSFYYQYIAKIQLPQKQIHLLFGGAVHSAIEGMYNKLEPHGIFDEKFDINKLSAEEKSLHEEYVKLGHEMVKNYVAEHGILEDLYHLNAGTSELYIKRHLKNPITGELSSIPMSGRIDRLTDAGIIIDYKTSSHKWSAEDTGYKIQTELYNLWYYSEYGRLPEETLYIVLLKKYKEVDKKESQVIQLLSKHCTMDELASTFEEVEIILSKINNGDFERPLGFHPPYCDCHRYEEALKVN